MYIHGELSADRPPSEPGARPTLLPAAGSRPPLVFDGGVTGHLVSWDTRPERPRGPPAAGARPPIQGRPARTRGPLTPRCRRREGGDSQGRPPAFQGRPALTGGPWRGPARATRVCLPGEPRLPVCGRAGPTWRAWGGLARYLGRAVHLPGVAGSSCPRTGFRTVRESMVKSFQDARLDLGPTQESALALRGLQMPQSCRRRYLMADAPPWPPWRPRCPADWRLCPSGQPAA